MSRWLREFVESLLYGHPKIDVREPVGPPHSCVRDGCYDLSDDERVVDALRVIEAAARGTGATQLGAAFALGVLAGAVDARPGWGPRHIARALAGRRVPPPSNAPCAENVPGCTVTRSHRHTELGVRPHPVEARDDGDGDRR